MKTSPYFPKLPIFDIHSSLFQKYVIVMVCFHPFFASMCVQRKTIFISSSVHSKEDYYDCSYLTVFELISINLYFVIPKLTNKKLDKKNVFIRFWMRIMLKLNIFEHSFFTVWHDRADNSKVSIFQL